MDRWPLVGRRNELAQLTAGVVAQRGAVITGATGVGKATLPVMCLERVQEGDVAGSHDRHPGVAGVAVRGLRFDSATSATSWP